MKLNSKLKDADSVESLSESTKKKSKKRKLGTMENSATINLTEQRNLINDLGHLNVLLNGNNITELPLIAKHCSPLIMVFKYTIENFTSFILDGDWGNVIVDLDVTRSFFERTVNKH